MSSLNAEQRSAVEHDGNLLLLAGAGSGKTLVLAHRAARLLGQPSGNLVAVTFTQEGAKELKSRILRLSPGQDKRVYSGTFHALAIQQLKRAGISFRILDDHGKKMFLLRALVQTEEDVKLEDMLKIVDENKSCLTHRSYSGQGHKTFHRYQEMLCAENTPYMDFGDLLIAAVEGMQSGTVKPIPMHWLLGDEFQDTDPAQYEWIRLHNQITGAEMTMVGDDDQSIYSFRHAMGYAGMERFKSEFLAKTIYLSNNYRCAPEILNPAARLISFNEYRAQKKIIPASDAGGELTVLRPRDRQEEARLLISLIQEDPRGWAILSRTNRLLDDMEIALQSFGIPYRRVGEQGFWDRFEPRSVLVVLQGIMAGGKWIAMPPKSYANPVTSAAMQAKISRYESDVWLGVKTALHLAGAEESYLGALLDKLRQKPIAEWAGTVSSERKAILESTNADHKHRIQNGIRFLENVSGWARVSVQDPELMMMGIEKWFEGLIPSIGEPCCIAVRALTKLRGSMAERLAFVSGKNQNKESIADSPETVILTTMHGSKGLEWPNVCIIGVENGVSPHMDGEKEEERRLFYVGMTRAKRRLVLSSVREGELSPFLIESGLDESQLALS